MYAGNEGGWFTAYSELTGQTLWSENIGTAIRSTPIIDGSSIWVVGTYSPRLIKLDAATGAQQCSTSPIYALGEASPVVATPPGGQRTIFMGSVDLAQNGPVYAFHTADCSLAWQNAPYPVGGGVWDFLSYAVDAPTAAFPSGEPLVLFGTSDPDGEVYALDATTGALVWRFQSAVVNNDSDIGAGVAVSAPGVNGFADGVAYTNGKDGITYAVDLTTGAQIWSYVFENPEVANGSRSTPSLAGNQLVFGTSVGTFDLNATTGALNWHYPLPAGDENLGAVAVEGPPGQRVVLTTNLDGQFQVLSLATGALLYSYQTGNYVGSSPAVVDQNILLTSADGFLYDFAVGRRDERLADDKGDLTNRQFDHRQSRPADHLGDGGRSSWCEPGPGPGAGRRPERCLVEYRQRLVGARSVQQPGDPGQSGGDLNGMVLVGTHARPGHHHRGTGLGGRRHRNRRPQRGRYVDDSIARDVHRTAQYHVPDASDQCHPRGSRRQHDGHRWGLPTR